MRGTFVRQTWEHNPVHDAPPRYRRACHYEAFIPDGLVGFDEPLTAELAGVVSEAESAIHQLNGRALAELAPLARLLLRSESIASSKLEGMQVDARDLARSEAKLERGGETGTTAREIIGHINAMELAIDHATTATTITIENIIEIRKILMDSARKVEESVG